MGVAPLARWGLTRVCLLLPQGYTAHIVSTVSEWSLAFAFLSFFLTYIRDFQVLVSTHTHTPDGCSPTGSEHEQDTPEERRKYSPEILWSLVECADNKIIHLFCVLHLFFYHLKKMRMKINFFFFFPF